MSTVPDSNHGEAIRPVPGLRRRALPRAPKLAPGRPVRAFRSEVLALYQPPLRSQATCRAMARVLAAVAELLGPAGTTFDLTPVLVASFITTRPAESPNTTFTAVARLRSSEPGDALGYGGSRRSASVGSGSASRPPANDHTTPRRNRPGPGGRPGRRGTQDGLGTVACS